MGRADVLGRGSRYAGEWNGIKISAAAAYNEWNDGNACGLGNTQSSGNATLNALGVNCITGSNSLSGFYPNPGKANYFQAGLYVEHVPTGLWGMVDYGHLSESGAQFYHADGSFIGTDILPDTTTWYFKAGLRERWTHLGHTVLYGEYLRNDDGNNINAAGAFAANTVNAAQVDAYNSSLHVWGLGMVQEIDAAAMSLWLSYRPTKNHSKESEIWLIYYRKSSGKPRISYNDAVEEALCFGWIDSTAKPVDDVSWAQRFTPRRKNSKLSELNKERVRQMIKAKKMTKFGLEKIKHEMHEDS